MSRNKMTRQRLVKIFTEADRPLGFSEVRTALMKINRRMMPTTTGLAAILGQGTFFHNLGWLVKIENGANEWRETLWCLDSDKERFIEEMEKER